LVILRDCSQDIFFRMKFLLNVLNKTIRGCSGVDKVGKSASSSVLTGYALSPVCGCISTVEMQLHSGEDLSTLNANARIESLKVTRERVMIGPDSKPLFTHKGNVLLRDCNCTSLNKFADVTETYSIGRTLNELRNEIFRSGVPVSFARTIRRKNKMPLQSENCLRLMNESLCDALGGDSLQERLHRSEMHWPRPGTHEFYTDDEDDGTHNYYDPAEALQKQE